MKSIIALICISLTALTGVVVMVASAEHPDEAALVAAVAIVAGAILTRR